LKWHGSIYDTWAKADWDEVIFSDECKFNLFYSDGIQRVWRKPGSRYEPKNLRPTVKYGGKSVMAWGCMSSKGVGKLIFIEGNMNSLDYVRILADNLGVSAAEMGLFDYIFQQDNDPKHTSGLARLFFSERGIRVLEWPSQSPDLNPIEHLWAYMKRRLAELAPKNINQLKSFLIEIWNTIPQEFLQKLVASMPKRCEEVIKARGGHTSY
jgi:DDE superfamily endonuclease